LPEATRKALGATTARHRRADAGRDLHEVVRWPEERPGRDGSTSSTRAYTPRPSGLGGCPSAQYARRTTTSRSTRRVDGRRLTSSAEAGSRRRLTATLSWR
jgi:hypothetical protein